MPVTERGPAEAHLPSLTSRPDQEPRHLIQHYLLPKKDPRHAVPALELGHPAAQYGLAAQGLRAIYPSATSRPTYPWSAPQHPVPRPAIARILIALLSQQRGRSIA